MQRAYPAEPFARVGQGERVPTTNRLSTIHDDIKCILKVFFLLFFLFFLFSQGNFSVSHTWSARPTTGASKISCLVVLFWQLSRQENLHGSGMSHAMTASLKHPSGHHELWATPWSAEELLDGQHQRVDIPAHTRTAHKGLLQKTGRWFLLNRPLRLPDDPFVQGTELNWTAVWIFEFSVGWKCWFTDSERTQETNSSWSKCSETQ